MRASPPLLTRNCLRDIASMDREALKDMLGSLAEKVVLDPVGLSCRIHYRIGIEGRNKLASPRDARLRYQRGIPWSHY
jgi:hypothetical protein